MRHEIDPEIDYNEKTLEELGNIGQYVVSIQRKYFYSQYKVKVQVSSGRYTFSILFFLYLYTFPTNELQLVI